MSACDEGRRWSVVCRSTPGAERRVNQDAVLARPGTADGPPAAIAVADGVSGMPGGDVASVTALAALADALTALESAVSEPAPDPVEPLLRAVTDGRRRLHQRGAVDAALKQMATTFTAVALRASDITVVHLGDSRAYLFRHGRLKRLTTDHTVAQDLVASGVLAAEAAPFHRGGHILTRCLTALSDAAPEVATLAAAAGDLLLVCSDGLYRTVDDDAIAAICGAWASPDGRGLEALADALIARASDAGATDNVSVALATLAD